MTVGEAAVKAVKMFGSVWRRKVIIKAGTGMTITESVSDDESTLTFDSSGGGGGAPTGAEYVTLATNGSLTNERVLTAGHGVDLVDAGAGSTITVDVDETELSHASLGDRAWASSGHTGTASRIAAFDGGGAASYLQVGVDVQAYSSTLGDLVTLTYAPADIEIRCDASPTLATGYEVVRGLLRTAHQYTTTTARSIAAASPEYGWTWANRTNIASADENTTTANAVYALCTTTSTDWYGATVTAPYRYQVVWWDGRQLEVIARIYSNGNANYESAGVCIANDATPTEWFRTGVGWSGGVPVLFGAVNGGVTNVTITSGERDAGVWVRMLLTQITASTALMVAAYSTSSSSTPPTSWTVISHWSANFTTFRNLRIGQMWATVNTTGHLAGGAKWFGWRFRGTSPLETTAPAFFHGRQYDTTAAAQTLIASFDLGTPGAAISDTALRTVLAARCR